MTIIEYFNNVVEENKNNTNPFFGWLKNKDFCEGLRRFTLASSAISKENQDIMLVHCFCLISLICDMNRKGDISDNEKTERLVKSFCLANNTSVIIGEMLSQRMEQNGDEL